MMGASVKFAASERWTGSTKPTKVAHCMRVASARYRAFPLGSRRSSGTSTFLQYARHADVTPGALEWCIWDLAREGNTSGNP